MPYGKTPDEAVPLIREYISADEEQAWLGLLNTHERLVRALHDELTAEHRISLSRYELLMRIAHAEDGEIAIRELADQVMLGASQVSRLVIELERDGLVVRRRNPADARSTRAATTDRGMERLREAAGTYLTTVRRLLLDQLSEREVKQLGSLWGRLERGAVGQFQGEQSRCGDFRA